MGAKRSGCPSDWFPHHHVRQSCYKIPGSEENTQYTIQANYSTAEHACVDIHPSAKPLQIDSEHEERLILFYAFHRIGIQEPLTIWLKPQKAGCETAMVAPGSELPYYEREVDCLQLHYYICEAPRDLLMKTASENNLDNQQKDHLHISHSNLGPKLFKREKYGKYNTMQEDEEDIINHRDHSRVKRAIGETFNGDDGSVLIEDANQLVSSISTNIGTTVTNIGAYVQEQLGIASGLYTRLKQSNLTLSNGGSDVVAMGNVMRTINEAMVKLGTVALHQLALGDEKMYTSANMVLHVSKETLATHKAFTVEDSGTRLRIPLGVDIVNSEDMFGSVVMFGPDRFYSYAPGTNGTSSLSARIVMLTFVDLNGTEMTARSIDEVEINFKLERQAESDEINVCSAEYEASDSFVHWSLTQCTEAKYQYSATAQDCRCTTIGTYASFQIFEPLAAGLQLLSWFGCGVSLLACLITALVVIGNQLMKTIRSFVRMMFLVSLGSAEAVFLTGTAWSDVKGVCGIVALWLHFSTLASFCWLLSYVLLLGNEMRKEKNYYLDLKLYNLIGWAVPACIVIITAIWNYQDYRDPILCWVSSDGYIYLSFVAPAGAIMFIILLFLLYDLKLLIVKKSEMKAVLFKPVAWSGIRSVFILLPLLGATWMFAEYAVITRNILTQLMFSIFNTLLGIFIFLFMCHFNEEIRMAKKQRKIFNQASHTVIRTMTIPKVEPWYEPSEKHPFHVLPGRLAQDVGEETTVTTGIWEDETRLNVNRNRQPSMFENIVDRVKSSKSRNGQVPDSKEQRPQSGEGSTSSKTPLASVEAPETKQEKPRSNASNKPVPEKQNQLKHSDSQRQLLVDEGPPHDEEHSESAL